MKRRRVSYLIPGSTFPDTSLALWASVSQPLELGERNVCCLSHPAYDFFVFRFLQEGWYRRGLFSLCQDNLSACLATPWSAVLPKESKKNKGWGWLSNYGGFGRCVNIELSYVNSMNQVFLLTKPSESGVFVKWKSTYFLEQLWVLEEFIQVQLLAQLSIHSSQRRRKRRRGRICMS